MILVKHQPSANPTVCVCAPGSCGEKTSLSQGSPSLLTALHTAWRPPASPVCHSQGEQGSSDRHTSLQHIHIVTIPVNMATAYGKSTLKHSLTPQHCTSSPQQALPCTPVPGTTPGTATRHRSESKAPPALASLPKPQPFNPGPT